MEVGHYSEVLSFLRSNTPRANWTAEQRQFYKRTYSVDKKGNLCDTRTGDKVTLLEDHVPRPPMVKDPGPAGSYAAYKYGKTNLTAMEQYRNANNKSPLEANRSPSRSRSPSYSLFSSSSSDKTTTSAKERETGAKPYVYQPMMKSRTRLDSELLESQKEKDKLYVYQPRGLSRSRLNSEDRDMPSSSSDSQRLKEDILEGDRMSRMQSEEREERGERESSVSSVSFRSSTPTQNVKYNSAEEEVDALRYLVRQQKRQIADQESKMRQLQCNLQMTQESKAAAEEVAKGRRNEAELEIKQLKDNIRSAKDTALADCKRQLEHAKQKLLAAEADLDAEAKRHSDAFRKSQNELSQTRGDLATALEESEQRRIEHEKETEKLRKAEFDLKSQSEQITRLEAFVAQLKLKLSLNIQTVVEQQAKMTANEAKLAAQKTFVQELQAKIFAKDSAIQTMRKKLFDAMQMLPDLDTPRKLKTIFENEMESALPDIVDITLKNGTYFADNQRRSRAKVEAALRLCEEIEELEASNEHLLQEYEEAMNENADEIAIVALTTMSNDSSSPSWNADLCEAPGENDNLEFFTKLLPKKHKEQRGYDELENTTVVECVLPEEETSSKGEPSTLNLNVEQSCETPTRIQHESFLKSKENLLQENQDKLLDNTSKMISLNDSSPPKVDVEQLCETLSPVVSLAKPKENLSQEKPKELFNNASEKDSLSDTSPKIPIKSACENTEANNVLESNEQQVHENEKELDASKNEKVATIKKSNGSAVPQIQKVKKSTSKQDFCSPDSSKKTEPVNTDKNSSSPDANENRDSKTIVDENVPQIQKVKKSSSKQDLSSLKKTDPVNTEQNLSAQEGKKNCDSPTVVDEDVPQIQKAKKASSKQDICNPTSPNKIEAVNTAQNPSAQDAKENCDSPTVVDENVPQIKKVKKSSIKQDLSSPKKTDPVNTEQNLSAQDTRANCDSPTVVDENASAVANAVADAIASAHANATAIVDELEKETPPTAKDEQLANSMKKLESLRQRLNQKKAVNNTPVPEST